MFESVNLVFIICRGRSGSTLLQSILDAHPEICAPIESKFVLHLATKYKNVKNWDAQKIQRFCDDLYTNRKFRLFWKVDKNDLLEKFKKQDIQTFEDACKVVWLSHQSVFEKTQIKLIVDKNPPYSRYLDLLNALFPSAKFIYMTREPKSVVYSHIAAFQNRHIYRLALEWNLLNSLNLKFKKNYPHKIFTVKYEDLVRKPQKTFSGVFDFLKIPFSKDLLNSFQTREKTISESTFLNLPHHRNISKPIDPKIVEKWQGNLTENEIQIIESITFPIAKKLGYKTENHTLGFALKIKLFFAKIETNGIHKAYRLLFKIPFFMRRLVFDFVSLFFDRKYKKDH